MMSNYKKYGDYKDTGIDVLERAPAHWKVLKGQFIFKVINERSKTGKELLLSVSEKKGVTPRSEANVTMFMAESYVGYKLCKTGDLVINSLWAWSNGLGFSEYDGIVSTAYSVYRPDHNKFNYRFLHYLLKTKLYVDQFRIYSKGIWTSRLQLHDWTFLRIPIVSPEKAEQKSIAKFLDHKTTQIDKFIRTKEKTIALLQERKAAIINQAVTKGLDPNVPMKDSGIEWLGEIPEHWEVSPLKRFIASLESGVSVNASETENAKLNEVGVLKTSCVYNYEFDPLQNKKVFDYELKRVACRVRKNSIIISRMNAPNLVGASGYVHSSFDNLFLPDRLWQTVYRRIKFSKIWLSNVLASKAIRFNLKIVATGTSPSMKNISKPNLLSIQIPVPTFDEQELIVKEIETKSRYIEKLIKYNRKEITLIKEYRESLISAAVTGKINVRSEILVNG